MLVEKKVNNAHQSVMEEETAVISLRKKWTWLQKRVHQVKQAIATARQVVS